MKVMLVQCLRLVKQRRTEQGNTKAYMVMLGKTNSTIQTTSYTNNKPCTLQKDPYQLSTKLKSVDR
jgi:hypothetical protein